MKKLIGLFAVLSVILTGYTVFAAEKTVTLKLRNMTCPSCIYMIKSSLGDVQGVSKVKVSYDNKIAIVTYDDAKITTNALTEATKNAGFPSTVIK